MINYLTFKTFVHSWTRKTDPAVFLLNQRKESKHTANVTLSLKTKHNSIILQQENHHKKHLFLLNK